MAKIHQEILLIRSQDGTLKIEICGPDMPSTNRAVLREEILQKGDSIAKSQFVVIVLNDQGEQLWDIIHRIDNALDDTDPSIPALFAQFALAGYQLALKKSKKRRVKKNLRPKKKPRRKK